MPELYEKEPFIHEQIPIQIFNHFLDGNTIFTPTHWHHNIEINLVTKGRIQHIVDGESFIQQENDILFINSGVLHSNHWVDLDDHFEGITLQISKQFLIQWLGKNMSLVLSEDKKIQTALIDILLQLSQSKIELSDASDSFQIDCLKLKQMELLFQLLLILRKDCVVPEHTESKKEIQTNHNMKEIVRYLEEHYSDDLSLSTVAEVFHYSPTYLSKLFKKRIGMSFHDYIQHVRLTNCIEIMKTNSSISLAELSLSQGFPNIKSFIETFKKFMGVTPSVWLKTRI